MQKYKFIDAFCGAGGMGLGLISAGFEPILSFDNDRKCIETLKKNPQYFHHSTVCASIESLLKNGSEKTLQSNLFLLAGGPPCQGFSVQRIGNDQDERNTLVMKFISLAEKLRPKFVLFENVAGITGKRGQAILDLAINRLERIGYTPHIKLIDAQDYGVPQRRKRIFIVAEFCKDEEPVFDFPNDTITVKKTVRETIGHLPPPPEDGNDHKLFVHHKRDKLSALNIERLKALKPGQGRDFLPKKLLADCHKRNSASIGHRNVYGRMEWDKVSPTITARFDSFTRGQFGHPEQPRTISLREGALLQTFPEDFVFAGNKVDIARQIGNAVPPLLAEKIGKQIIKCYENSKVYV